MAKAAKPGAKRKTAKRGAKTKRGKPVGKRAPRAPFTLPPGWALADRGKAIAIEVRAKDFVDAMDLLNSVTPIAEELEHHPDLHLTRWNRVRIVTYSHDVGKLTERDERLARRITEMLQRRSIHEHVVS